MTNRFSIDPVCHMKVAEPAKTACEYEGQHYAFCCPHCRAKFLSAPEKFLKPAKPAKPAAYPPGTRFICPMDPEVRADRPGPCPVCGMALEPETPTAGDDGEYRAMDEEPNFALGCDEDFHFAVQETTLVPGDRLFLYTDGVSEAMNGKGELFGKERILSTLNDSRGLPSDEVFFFMMEAMSRFVDGAEQSDDACMVALDYASEERLVFSPDADGLAKVEPFVDEFLKGYDPDCVSAVQVILDELCSNVVFYSKTDLPVYLVLRNARTDLKVTIIDHGIAFDPLERQADVQSDGPGGLGILMAKSMADELLYRRVDGYNIVQFKKKLKAN